MSTSNPAVPPSEYLFKVEGLHCANCIQKVKRLEGPERSWETISVDLGKQLLTVVPRPHFDTDEFQKAVSDLGFSIRNIRISKKLKELQKQENRWFLARLGIAGAFAGNIMLIAFALYSGADQTEWRLPLQWLSFVLFLPVLFFSGWPFLKNGFQSLRRMQSSIDLPIAVALVGGTSLSFYNLLANSTYIYFDSLGILVFLILSTRYLVYRVQVNHLEPVSVKDFLGKTAFFKLHNQSERVGFEELEKGNLLELNEGDAVPADGILESKIAEFDTSMITGEALPQKIKQFEAVYSGSKVLTSGVLVRLTKGFQNSRAMLLISSINKAMNQKTPLTSFTDKAAQILTSLVVFCGSLFFIFYFSIDSSAAVNRTLALLVIACPCALAIATPLSLSLGIRKAFKKGIIIKKPEAIEKLKSCHTVIFDKTGTLTKSEVEVVEFSEELRTKHKNILLTLEKQSVHPFGKAIVRGLSQETSENLEVINFEERPGVGVFGKIEGEDFSVRRLENGSTKYQAGFFRGSELISSIQFSSTPYEDSLTSIKKLRNMGYTIFMFTGDQNSVSQDMAKAMGIDQANVMTQMTPESKSDFVEKLLKDDGVIFVGDGLNDSLAMSKASVAISAYTSVDASYKTSDVHLLKHGVSDVVDLINISNKTIDVIKINLSASLVYNVIFGGLALTGFINPLVAAFLMPISSFSVIGHSIFRLRG